MFLLKLKKGLICQQIHITHIIDSKTHISESVTLTLMFLIEFTMN